MTLKTVKDLKEYLQEKLDSLQKYDNNSELIWINSPVFVKETNDFLDVNNKYLCLNDPLLLKEEE